MNIFVRQNFGKGVAFKNFRSWMFESRFLCNLTEILGNNGGASGAYGFLFIEWIAIYGNAASHLS